jgi:hypothetical protein
VSLASGAEALFLEGDFFGALEALPTPKGVSFRDGRANSRFLTALSARFGMTK